MVQACVGCKREKDGVVTQLQFVWGVCCAAACLCGGYAAQLLFVWGVSCAAACWRAGRKFVAVCERPRGQEAPLNLFEWRV